MPVGAHAFGPGAGQDKSAELFTVVLSFPVITLAASAGAVVLGRPAGRSRAMLRAFGGALLGLVITSVLAVVLMASSTRDAGFVATSVLTLGAIPAGLIGLIVGGLVSMMERRQPKP